MKTENSERTENYQNVKNEENDMNGITTDGYTANAMYDNIRWGNGWNNAGVSAPYTNLSALQHGLNYNRQHDENQHDATRDVLSTDIANVSSSFENLTRDNQFTATAKAISDSTTRLCDSVINGEFRTNDRIRDVEKLVIDGQKEQAKCCCEGEKGTLKLAAEMEKGFAATNLKMAENQSALLLKMCEDKNETLAKMAEGFAGIKDRELNAANAKITQLETINALQNNHHPH